MIQGGGGVGIVNELGYPGLTLDSTFKSHNKKLL